MAKHYIVVDNDDLVIDSFSDAFRKPSGGEIEVNSNGGRHFNLNLRDKNTNPRLKWNGSAIVERTEDERDPMDNLKQRMKDRVFKAGIHIMQKTQWKVDRHREELELSIATTLTPTQYTTLLTQRKTIRDKIIQFYQQITDLSDRQLVKDFAADFSGE